MRMLTASSSIKIFNTFVILFLQNDSFLNQAPNYAVDAITGRRLDNAPESGTPPFKYSVGATATTTFRLPSGSEKTGDVRSPLTGKASGPGDLRAGDALPIATRL